MKSNFHLFIYDLFSIVVLAKPRAAIFVFRLVCTIWQLDNEAIVLVRVSFSSCWDEISLFEACLFFSSVVSLCECVWNRAYTSTLKD